MEISNFGKWNLRKKTGGGKLDLCKIAIRHLRELMDERDKALRLQAKVDEIKTDLLRKEIEDLKKAGYVTKSFLWTAILGITGLIYFLLNYFKK